MNRFYVAVASFGRLCEAAWQREAPGSAGQEDLAGGPGPETGRRQRETLRLLSQQLRLDVPALAIVFLLAPIVAAAQFQYTPYTLPLPPGETYVNFRCFNDQDEAAVGGEANNYFWRGDRWQALGIPPDLPEAWYGNPVSMNNKGQVVVVVGWLDHQHTYVWHDGSWEELGSLNGSFDSTFGTDINDAGQVVGYSQISEPSGNDNGCRPVLWDNGGMQQLPTLFGSAGQANGINSHGDVVGQCFNPAAPGGGATRATLWHNGSLSDLGTLGGQDSLAQSINDLGQIAGRACLPDGHTAPFLWENGAMRQIDMGYPWWDVWVLGISNGGQVLGYHSNSGQVVLWWNNHVYYLGNLGASGAFYINHRGDLSGNAPPNGSPTIWHPVKRPWVFLYYLCNSGDLEHECEATFRAVAEPPVIPWYTSYALWDHKESQDGLYRIWSDDDWEGGYERWVNFWRPTDIGLASDEINTGDVGVLKKYIDFVVGREPAQHYALVISSHASGVSPRGIGNDDDPTSYLSVKDLGDACAYFKSVTGQNLDVLHLDACLMQMAEVNYQVCGSCDWLVASEDLSQGASGVGWEGDYLSNVALDTPPVSLAQSIAGSYFDFLTQGNYEGTISVTAPPKSSPIASSVDGLAGLLIYHMKDLRSVIETARFEAQKFAFDDTDNSMTPSNVFLDLRDFCDELQTGAPFLDVRNAAAQVEAAVAYCVLFERHLDSPGATDRNGFYFDEGTNGMSIFFPPTTTQVPKTYLNYVNASPTPANLAWCASTQWDDFLRAYLEWGVLRVFEVGQAAGATVDIQCSPDRYGHGGGTPTFARIFAPWDQVILTAPPKAGDRVFLEWMVNGTRYSSDRTVTIPVIKDVDVTAVYYTVRASPPAHRR